LVLGHSLRQTGTNKKMTIMITEGVSANFRDVLQSVYDNIVIVKPLRNYNEHNLGLIGRPNLGITYTKLYCWKLIQFSKCVFLDADTVVLQNIDELFEREELSAAPDVSWPDLFNSGVFVFRPSLKTFSELSHLTKTSGSFDGGDQGLLNEYFSGWSTESLNKHLPFAYNCSCWVTPNDRLVFYTRAPAWKKFGNQVKVAHFTGLQKPWKYGLSANDTAICHAIERLKNSNTNFTDAEQISVLALWWAIFFKKVKQHLSYGMFLSTTFEPVPLSLPKPMDRYASCNQDQNEFYLENEQYHPEFHDTSFDHLHSGQRVDEAKRFEKYYVYEQPLDPVEFQCRKYCEAKMEHGRHDVSYHQQPTCREERQNQLLHPEHYHSRSVHQEYHQEHYDRTHQEGLLLQRQQHQQNEKCHHDKDCQHQQHWCDQTHHRLMSSPAPSEQDRVETQQNATPSHSLPSLQTQSLPEQQEVRNDKDPLFFAPHPMCCECLKELQWSRQFVDPFHRRLITPISSLSVVARVRRRSTPLLPLGLQVIRNSQKPVLPVAAIDEPAKMNGHPSRKKEKASCLHQIQKGNFSKKKRWRKSSERGKLLDAAKKQIQLKENTNVLTSAASLISTSEKSRMEPQGENTTTLSTALDTMSTLTAQKRDVGKHSMSSASVPYLTVAQDTSSALLTSAATSDVKRMQSKEDNRTSLTSMSAPITADVINKSIGLKADTIDATDPGESVSGDLYSWQGGLSQGSRYFCNRHRPHAPPPDWRMFAWERGDIDYTGSDRFSNILARIRTTIQQSEEEAMPIGVWL
uniref:glycogenin glucosyltransferase n=1 Tax=Hydatigena taeniaeformis TaxID=6205 RepID=A0A0R3WMH7_HYDTA